MRVWQYALNPVKGTDLMLPRGAEIFHVGEQHGTPYLWALVETKSPTEKRVFYAALTGEEVPEHFRYIGTFQIESMPFIGRFVGHVFEKRGA